MQKQKQWAYGCSPFGHNPLTGQVATQAEMGEHTALAQQLARSHVVPPIRHDQFRLAWWGLLSPWAGLLAGPLVNPGLGSVLALD